MTTILLVILGVLLAAAAVLMVVYYGGDAFGNGRIEAEAGRLVTEGAQIEGALELYYRQEGHYPRDDDPIAQMIAAKYLTHAPLGTRTTEADKWSIDYDAGMIRAKLGPLSDKDTKNICLKARQQLDLPASGTSSGIYRCDGTDSPGGKLGGREPCCIGPVGVGGGAPASGDIFATATLCNNLGSMPVNTDQQKAAYIVASGSCVKQRLGLTNQRFTSLSDVGSPPIDFAASQSSFIDVYELSTGDVFYRQILPNKAACLAVGVYADGLNGSYSVPSNPEDQCMQGYHQPYYYYKKLTDTYRPAQISFLEAEADKIKSSILQKGYLGSDMTDFVETYGGYMPNMKGQTSSPWSFYEAGDYVQLRAYVPNASLCTWFRKANGYSTNQYDSGYTYPSYCSTVGSGAAFQRDVTTQVHTARFAALKSEADKLRDAMLASSYAGFDMAEFIAQGGYKPNLPGFSNDDWQIRSDPRGAVNLRITHSRPGMCNWWRRRNGYGTNQFDALPREPEYCAQIYNGPAYYDRNISVPYRAKQKQIMQRERLKLRADYVAHGGDTAAMTYQPNFNGASSNSGSFYTTGGKTYFKTKVDEGLCYYLYDEAAATNYVSVNLYNFYYRKEMCFDFYRDAKYALLDLTVD